MAAKPKSSRLIAFRFFLQRKEEKMAFFLIVLKSKCRLQRQPKV